MSVDNLAPYIKPPPGMFFRVSKDGDGDIRITLRRRRKFLPSKVVKMDFVWYSDYEYVSDEEVRTRVADTMRHLVKEDFVEQLCGDYPPKVMW